MNTYNPESELHGWPGIMEMSHSHYKKFTAISDSTKDGLIPNYQDGIKFSQSLKGLKIRNTSTARQNILLIKDIYIKGTNQNIEFIRPRIFNTNKLTHEAVFTVRIKIKANSGGDSKNNIYMKISNQFRGPDTLNDSPLPLARIPLSTGTFANKFKLKTSYSSAYSFGFKLELFADLEPEAGFLIEEITVYDELGKDIVEDDFINKSGHPDGSGRILGVNYGELVKEGFESFNCPIIHLADEPTVGNFIPMQKIISELQKKFTRSTPYFYLTNPQGISIELTSRMLNEVEAINPLYIGINRYAFESWKPVNSFCVYARSINNEYAQVLKNVRDVSRQKKCKLICVPQLHEVKGQLRNPTENEILATSYIALLSDYKGIAYYQAIYDARDDNLYKKDKNNNPDTYGYVLEKDNLDPSKLNALNIVSKFLCKKIRNSNETNGEFLLNHKINDFEIIGADERGISKNSKDLDIDPTGSIRLSRIEIVDPDNLKESNKESLAGVGSVSDGDKAYYLLTNLNQKERDLYLRLFFSSESFREMKVQDLTNGSTNCSILSGRAVDVKIPSKNAVLLQVSESHY